MLSFVAELLPNPCDRSPKEAHSLVSARAAAENLVVRAGKERFLCVAVGLVVRPDADAFKANNRGFVASISATARPPSLVNPGKRSEFRGPDLRRLHCLRHNGARNTFRPCRRAALQTPDIERVRLGRSRARTGSGAQMWRSQEQPATPVSSWQRTDAGLPRKNGQRRKV